MSASKLVLRLPGQVALLVFACVFAPVLMLFFPPHPPQNNPLWDVMMGVGVMSAGFLIAVPAISPRLWIHYLGDPQTLRYVLSLHRDLSYVAVLLCAVHVVGLLLIDEITIEYLKLSAPWSMLAANVSFLMFLFICLTSVFRVGLGWNYASWRAWHGWLSLVAIVLMAYHVLDAGYYVNSKPKSVIFLALLIAPSLAPLAYRGWRPVNRRSSDHLGPPDITLSIPARRFGHFRLLVLLCALWTAIIFIYSIPTPDSRAEVVTNPCPTDVCG